VEKTRPSRLFCEEPTLSWLNAGPTSNLTPMRLGSEKKPSSHTASLKLALPLCRQEGSRLLSWTEKERLINTLSVHLLEQEGLSPPLHDVPDRLAVACEHHEGIVPRVALGRNAK
jgi:hypothetical protein